MKAVLCCVACAAVGCASGGSFGNGPSDSQPGQPQADAPAAPPADASPDAPRPIDAEPIDAAPDARIIPIDAAIDARPDACVPQQTELLANPVFDLTPVGTGWTQVPVQNVVCNGVPCGPFPLINDDITAQSAPFNAFLGGLTGSDVNPAQGHITDQLFQDVAVPPNTTSLVLTGFFIVATNDFPDEPYDTADVALLQTNGTPIEDVMALSNQSAGSTDWAPFSHTFTTIPSGQTVRLRFTSTNDDSFNTNFFFDTLSLTAIHGCP